MTMENISKKIDHTLLKASATQADIIRICAEAKQYGFASVCVNSCYAKLVTRQLRGTDVKTCCVVGFPLGAMSTAAKAYEAKCAVEDGASEIDMVINVGALKEGNDLYVEEDISAVVEAAKPAIVKVIIETCLLTDEEKVRACSLSESAGAAFVKTSTGFSTGGANVHDVALMKKTVDGRLQVKASGGIHTPEQAQELIAAGADRIGASNGVALLG
jgi:deoxyribose-phosphate aldolase